MKFKYVLFDFDGTLADTEQVNFEIFQKLSDQYNIRHISSNELSDIKKLNAIQLIDYLNIKKHKIPFMLRKGKKLLKNNIKSIELCKNNFEETLIELKNNGIKMAIVTTNSKTNVSIFLENHNINYFDYIISSSIFGKERKIIKFLKKDNINPNEVLYVGDEIRDINAAKNSGIKVASVTWGYNTIDSLLDYNPDYIINEPYELIKICD